MPTVNGLEIVKSGKIRRDTIFLDLKIILHFSGVSPAFALLLLLR